MVTIEVDPSDATANLYFKMGDVTYAGSTATAPLLVAGALDIETNWRIQFNLITRDTVNSDTQTIIIRKRNVNDHR